MQFFSSVAQLAKKFRFSKAYHIEIDVSRPVASYGGQFVASDNARYRE
jgi:hypothetical protein